MTAVPSDDRDRDLIGDLAAVLDGLAGHVARADGQARRSESNRLTLLHVHAAAALLIGVTFATVNLSGSAWAVVRLIPGAPWSLAGLIASGGLLLGVSTVRRCKRTEIVALSVLATWYAIMAVSFGGSIVLWYAANPPSGPRPALYPPVVYAHLAVIMLVHVWTLSRMRRSDQVRT